MSINVGDFMTRDVVTVNAGDSLGRAVAIMEERCIGGLPVMDEGKLVGVITSRDIRRAHPNRLIADAMSRTVFSVTPQTPLYEAKNLLEEHMIERLVVVEGDQPVGVINKIQIYSEVGKNFDALTNLSKATLFKQRAADFLRQGKEIVIIFFDIDNFGLIDKELGHVIGDRILQSVADGFRNLMNVQTDVLCRYAGDEFAVATLRPLEEARQWALNILEVVASSPMPGGITVTVSAGLAGGRRMDARSRGEETRVVCDLLNMASLASTRAKKAGQPLLLADELELQVKTI